ncbi:hypothetical protein EBZ80_25230 [bacterium]|nr:hypothetical protein [bacterium]
MRLFNEKQLATTVSIVEAYSPVMAMAVVGLSEDKTMMTVNEIIITVLDDGIYHVGTASPLLDKHRGEAYAKNLLDAVGLAVVMAIEADVFRCINSQGEENEQLH